MSKKQISITNPFACILATLVIFLTGCTSQPAPVSPIETSSVSLIPTPTPLKVVRPSPIPLPSPTPSPLPSPTPTSPPYSDTPFTVVFLRSGNLWASEIGGIGERQFTTEPIDWPVYWFDVSPQCDKIAYIVYQGPPTIDAFIKQVNISTGAVSVLAGQNDPYSECEVKWLDDNHIAFQLQEGSVSGFEKSPTIWAGLEPFHHIVVDLTNGERTFVPESLVLTQSPNGRYWLTCTKVNPYGEGGCRYKLQDRTTGKQWPIFQDLDWVGFVTWSPDSQFMLFIETPGFSTETYTRLRVMNAATREEETIVRTDKFVSTVSLSADGRTIAFSQCDSQSAGSRSSCVLSLVSSDGTNAQEIPIDLNDAVLNLSWTPDDSRLVFSQEGSKPTMSNVWSVRTDGTDLRPIILNADSFRAPVVLCQR